MMPLYEDTPPNGFMRGLKWALGLESIAIVLLVGVLYLVWPSSKIPDGPINQSHAEDGIALPHQPPNNIPLRTERRKRQV